MARTIQLAVAAARVAMDDGKVDRRSSTRPASASRSGPVSSLGTARARRRRHSHAEQLTRHRRPHEVGHGGPRERSRRCGCSSYLPNMLATHVSILQNARGRTTRSPRATWPACSPSAGATRILRRGGFADFFLVGGADAKINPLSLARQAGFNQMAKCFDPAEKACRPADAWPQRRNRRRGQRRHRRGAGAREEARAGSWPRCSASGPPSIAAGTARAWPERCEPPSSRRTFTSNNSITSSTPTVPKSSGHRRMGKPRGSAEACGSVPVTVWGVKSLHGQPRRPAATLAELAASVLAVQHGLLPGTLNYENPDPACPVPVTRPESAGEVAITS